MIKRKKKGFPFWELNGPYLSKLEFPSPTYDLCKVWSKLAQCLWRRFFFYFLDIFSLIRCYLLLEKGRAIHWDPPPKKKNQKKNLNSLSPKMLCAESGRNWPSGSAEDVNIFSLFLYYLPLKNGGALHLNKLESFSLKNALCQVWLKLTQSFWRRCRKCEKLTDKRTDGRWTMGDLSFQPRWAKEGNEFDKNFYFIENMRQFIWLSPPQKCESSCNMLISLWKYTFGFTVLFF